MRFTRRQFMGVLGAMGAAASARAGINIWPWNRDRSRVLTVAAIGDLHLLDVRSASIVGRAVQQINADPRVCCTVVLGDIASSGQLSELKLGGTVLSGLEKPFYAVPGNHDVSMAMDDVYGNFEACFGPGTWQEEEGAWVFLGLDSCNGDKSDVSIRPDRIAWLERRLKKIRRKRPIALFVHHPFNPSTKAYRVINAEEVLGLFAEHNLRLVAAGHYHGNQVETRDRILFTTTACCSTTRGNHDGTDSKGYRLFHLHEDGRVETEFVEVSV